jgi:hypothetical protein
MHFKHDYTMNVAIWDIAPYVSKELITSIFGVENQLSKKPECSR